MIEYDNLNEQYILNIFPELKRQIDEEMQGFDRFLPHVIFGNILNPIVVNLLKKEKYKQDAQLNKIFEMYEQFAIDGDIETQNLLQVTLLEYLWDEKITFDRALEMMGEKTKEIWQYIYDYILVPTE